MTLSLLERLTWRQKPYRVVLSVLLFLVASFVGSLVLGHGIGPLLVGQFFSLLLCMLWTRLQR